MALATAVLDARAADAKYRPPALFELAGAADLVVLGDITRVDAKTFTLLVREVLAGQEDAAELEVVRFVDWTCSHRWKPYAVGQREIAFLHRLDEKRALETGARFGLMSSGDEGEWEIVDNEVSVQGERVSSGRADDQGEHPGQWLPLSDVLNALRDYRTCFAVSGDDLTLSARQLCSAGALDEYRRRSAFHAYLVRTSAEITATTSPIERLPAGALRP